MKTLKEIESHIQSIALRSSKFKIGKTGQDGYNRLMQHPQQYKYLEEITWSKYWQNAEWAEDRMIDIFFHRKNCDNKNRGSAGNMKRCIQGLSATRRFLV